MLCALCTGCHSNRIGIVSTDSDAGAVPKSGPEPLQPVDSSTSSVEGPSCQLSEGLLLHCSLPETLPAPLFTNIQLPERTDINIGVHSAFETPHDFSDDTTRNSSCGLALISTLSHHSRHYTIGTTDIPSDPPLIPRRMSSSYTHGAATRSYSNASAPSSPLPPRINLCASSEVEECSSEDDGRSPIRRRRQFILPSDRAIGGGGGSGETSVFTYPSAGSSLRSEVLKRRTAENHRGKTDQPGTPGTPGSTGSASSVGVSPTTSMSDVAPLLRSVSLRVRHQVASTLSDPLKRRADLLGAELNKRKKRVERISKRLHMPKFLSKSQRSLASENGGASSSGDESEDPELVEQIERERIVEMYEKGPENKNIDPWENPDFELYKNTDRHGFVHKDGKVAPDEAARREQERIQREIRREKKWLGMLKQWANNKPVKKLEERVWKGIPTKLRITVWPRLLGVEELKRQSRGDKVYDELLVRARLVSKDIKQIDLDINRTYRDHMAFRRRYDVKQQSLLNVLAAYSMYNTEVGYCQGMSQIAALFLMFLDEEDAFWCLHSLMVSPKHSMHGFFVPGFPKLQRFEAHFKKILKKYKPRVYKHLDKQDIPYIYLTKWWFGCFLDRVPFPLALRLWDVFLLEGDVILTAMALNIMKMHEKAIRKLGIENFMEFVQTTIAVDFGYPDDDVIRSLREVLTKLGNDRAVHPPPPEDGALPEKPTKAFGPVLSRSVAELRAHAQEVRSRSSRANSVATGRTPQPRRRSAKAPPSPAAPRSERTNTSAHRSISEQVEREVPFEVPFRGPSSSSDVRRLGAGGSSGSALGPSSNGRNGRGEDDVMGPGGPPRGLPPMGIAGREHMRAMAAAGSSSSGPGQQQQLPQRSIHQSQHSSSSIRSNQPPPVPAKRSIDEDSRRSTYDNVSSHSREKSSVSSSGAIGHAVSIRDENTGNMVCVMRASDEEDDESLSRSSGAGRRATAGHDSNSRLRGNSGPVTSSKPPAILPSSHAASHSSDAAVMPASSSRNNFRPAPPPPPLQQLQQQPRRSASRTGSGNDSRTGTPLVTHAANNITYVTVGDEWNNRDDHHSVV